MTGAYLLFYDECTLSKLSLEGFIEPLGRLGRN